MIQKVVVWLGGMGAGKWGWYAAAAALAVCLASLRGCSAERTERARLAASVKQAEIRAGEFEAALKAKDKTIRALERQVESIDCRGSLNKIVYSDGTVEWRCDGEVKVNTVFVKDTSDVEITPLIPPPPPVDLPTIKVDRKWGLGAGGGVTVNGPIYYVRGRYRFVDVVGLYPAGAMVGLNVAW